MKTEEKKYRGKNRREGDGRRAELTAHARRQKRTHRKPTVGRLGRRQELKCSRKEERAPFCLRKHVKPKGSAANKGTIVHTEAAEGAPQNRTGAAKTEGSQGRGENIKMTISGGKSECRKVRKS